MTPANHHHSTPETAWLQYLRHQDSGPPVGPEALISQFPDCSGPLREWIDDDLLMQSVVLLSHPGPGTSGDADRALSPPHLYQRQRLFRTPRTNR